MATEEGAGSLSFESFEEVLRYIKSEHERLLRPRGPEMRKSIRLIQKYASAKPDQLLEKGLQLKKAA